jgi:hypothetical protein
MPLTSKCIFATATAAAEVAFVQANPDTVYDGRKGETIGITLPTPMRYNAALGLM